MEVGLSSRVFPVRKVFLESVPLGFEPRNHATLDKVIPFVIHENTQRGILLLVILPSAKLSSFLSGKARKRFD